MERLKSFNFNALMVIFFVLFPLFIIRESADATIYYVSPSGSDSNNGSQSAPFRNIQKAADIVQAGDTVNVRQGTYGNFHIQNKSGTSTNWIVFKSYPGDTVIVDGYSNNYVNGDHIITVENSTYIEINGLKITDSNPKYDSSLFSDYSQGYGRNGIKITDYSGNISHDLKILNNEFYHLGESAILTNPNTYSIEISNNTFHDVGLCKRGYCLYIGGHHQTVRNNICNNAYGIGIQIQNNVYTILVEKNKVYNNGHSDYGAGYTADGFSAQGQRRGDGIYVAWCSSCNIRNNIVYNNLTYGIRLSGNGPLNVYNNTVYHNGSYGLYLDNGTGAVFRNNISYMNSTSDYYIISGNSQDHNLFGTDPKFADTAHENFHLLSGSPAIDAGTTISPPIDDFEGNVRPYNGVYDIGAYEYIGSSSPPPADITPPAPPTVIGVQ